MLKNLLIGFAFIAIAFLVAMNNPNHLKSASTSIQSTGEITSPQPVPIQSEPLSPFTWYPTIIEIVTLISGIVGIFSSIVRILEYIEKKAIFKLMLSLHRERFIPPYAYH